MKQLLFLLLFPCLCVAQYTGNGNQKITLGEQTSADGLVWRGVLNDTALITPFSDTSAYIILDTVNNRFYNYNRTTNVWNLAGGGVSVSSFSAGTTGLTPSTATTGAVTLGGTLAVANGGTGSGTKNFVDLTTTQTVAGAKTFSNKSIFSAGFEAGNSLAGGLAFTLKNTTNTHQYEVGYSLGAGYYFYQVYDGSAFRDLNMNNLLHLKSSTNVGIGTTSPLSKLNVIGTVRINSASAPDANYYLQLENSSSQKAIANAWDTYSDKRIKTDIQPIYNAIDKVNSLNPVYYQKHDSYVENDFLNIDFDSSVKSLGFIAQEVYNVIPEAVNTGTTNELWAMDYTKIIPILTKAIQEQQALIKALEQRILILENK